MSDSRSWRFVIMGFAKVSFGWSRVPDASYTLRSGAERLHLPAKHKVQIAE